MALHNITDLEQDTPVSKVMNQNPFQPYTLHYQKKQQIMQWKGLLYQKRYNGPSNIRKAINQTLQLQIPPTISTQTAFHHFTQ